MQIGQTSSFAAISLTARGGIRASGKAREQEGREEPGSSRELSEEEQREVEELRQRDREVRSHEMAHVAAGGQYAGGASFEYQTGPDGKRYASGGEVPIDTSPVKGDPQATIRKMQVVRKAALAPAQPSGADRSVAAKASQQESKARQDLAQERTQGPGEEGAAKAPGTSEGSNDAPGEKSAGYTREGRRIPRQEAPAQAVDLNA